MTMAMEFMDMNGINEEIKIPLNMRMRKREHGDRFEVFATFSLLDYSV